MKRFYLLRVTLMACVAMVVGRGVAMAQVADAATSPKRAAAALVDSYYYLVTSTEQLQAGERYLIVAAEEDRAISTTQNANNRGQTAITKIGDAVRIDYTRGKQCEFILGGTTSAWTFQDVNTNKYLYAASSSSNYLRSQDTVDKNAQAKITIDGDNKASIVFQGKNSNNQLKHNTSSDIFSCYGSGNTQKPVQLYKRYQAMTIGEDGYATFYSNNAIVMPEGVVGGIITAATDGVLTVDYRYNSGAEVPAGTGLLVKGAAGTYPYAISTSADASPAGNMLYGVKGLDYAENTKVPGTDVRYYVLSKDAEGKNIGFYWAAEDGGATKWQVGKAFLAIDFGSGSKVYSGFSLDGGTTAISTIENTRTEDNRIYSLKGVYMGDDLKALPEGMYIVNGKKVVR